MVCAVGPGVFVGITQSSRVVPSSGIFQCIPSGVTGGTGTLSMSAARSVLDSPTAGAVVDPLATAKCKMYSHFITAA